MNIPSSVTQTLYVLLATTGSVAGQVEVSCYDLSKGDLQKLYNYILIKTVEIEVSIDNPPTFEQIQQEVIAGLRAQQEQLRADCQVKCNDIEAKIQDILSLEHKV